MPDLSLFGSDLPVGPHRVKSRNARQPAHANTINILAQPYGSGVPLAASITLSSDGQTATLTPTNLLVSSSSYTISMTTLVTSLKI